MVDRDISVVVTCKISAMFVFVPAIFFWSACTEKTWLLPQKQKGYGLLPDIWFSCLFSPLPSLCPQRAASEITQENHSRGVRCHEKPHFINQRQAKHSHCGLFQFANGTPCRSSCIVPNLSFQVMYAIFIFLFNSYTPIWLLRCGLYRNNTLTTP